MTKLNWKINYSAVKESFFNLNSPWTPKFPMHGLQNKLFLLNNFNYKHSKSMFSLNCDRQLQTFLKLIKLRMNFNCTI